MWMNSERRWKTERSVHCTKIKKDLLEERSPNNVEKKTPRKNS